MAAAAAAAGTASLPFKADGDRVGERNERREEDARDAP